MIQEIVAYLIISLAFGKLTFNILRFFNVIGKKPVNASKCGGCTSGCEMKELHQLSQSKPVKYDQYKFYL